MAVVLSLLFAAGIAEICLRILGPPYYRFNNLSEEYYTNPRGYHDVIRREGKHTVYGLTYHEDDNGYRLPPSENKGPFPVKLKNRSWRWAIRSRTGGAYDTKISGRLVSKDHSIMTEPE